MNTFGFSFLLLALACLATATKISFKADYEMRAGDLYPNGFISGTVYYRYDTDNMTSSRIRYVHSVSYTSGKVTIQELEDYDKKERYMICNGQCEASGFNWRPQQWWYNANTDTAGATEGEYTHYLRNSNSDSVVDLLLRQTTPPTDRTIKEITLSTGRQIKILPGTFSSYEYNSDIFDKSYGGVDCGKVVCTPKFMDVFFVLDESGSVTSKNWVKMLDFIANITDQLTISNTAAAVGVSAFGGKTYNGNTCNGHKYESISDVGDTWVDNCGEHRTTKYRLIDLKNNKVLKSDFNPNVTNSWSSSELSEQCCKKWETSGWSKKCPKEQFNSDRCKIEAYEKVETKCTYPSGYYTRCQGNFANLSRTGLFESALLMPLTVDTKENIKKAVREFDYLGGKCGTSTCLQGDTCQALGLIKAMDAFNRDENLDGGRAHKASKKPDRFVIVMTDGDDHCANMTAEYAEILKNEYGVKLYEVSIGLNYLYDKDLLMNLSTKFNEEASYFDVSDFDALANLLDKLLNDVCSQTSPHESTACGDCLGFCGCGTCYCPDCESDLSNVCHNYSCSTDAANIAFGCREKNLTCDDENACTTDRCDPTLGCKSETKVDCMEGLKTCEYSTCNPNGTGECSQPERIDSACYNSTYPEVCYTAVCEPGEGADEVTGCKFTYNCVGDFPAVFEEGNLVSGCYTYSCEQDENGKHSCSKKDHCADMSDACRTYTCDPDQGKCAISWERSCGTDNCVESVVCNPNANGNNYCQYKNKTVDYCLNAFLNRAASHYGEPGWPTTERLAYSYYTCGEISCSKNGNGEGFSEWDYLDGCVFVNSSQDCGMCSIPRTDESDTHATVSSCLESLIEHQKKSNTPSICYNVSCVPDGASSRCEYGTALECKSSRCYDAICNQTTLTCEYSMKEDFRSAKEANTDMCKNVYCDDINGPYIVDNSTDYCPPLADKCQELDHCGAHDRSCHYRKKYVRDNCTITTCDSATGVVTVVPVSCSPTNGCFESRCDNATDRCVEKRVDDEKKCGKVDNCHVTFCNVSSGDCVVEAKSYPNETNLCNNYTCVPTNSTEGESGETEPLWIVSPKCVASDICHTMTCSVLDGICREYDRVCDELNMTGYGDCYRAKCSVSRKNGCYRKVSPKSVFDECGNCIRGYSADDDTPVSQEELSACKDALKPYVPAAIGAGIIAAIVIACIIAAAAMTTAGTLATRELIRRARAANSQGAHDNPLFEEDGQEMENPTFVGTE